MFEQDRLLSRLQQRVRATTTIAVCYLTGSYGQRAENAYSDLDVVLGFLTVGGRAKAWAGRQEFAQSLSPYVPLHSDDGSVPFTLRAIFGNGAQVDLRYVVLNDSQPTWSDRHMRPIKDYQGWAERFQARAQQSGLAPIPMNEELLREINSRFWALYWDVFRQVLRGDHAGPFISYLALLNHVVSPLLAALPLADPARAPLLATRFDADMRATTDHLRALLHAYLGGRRSLMEGFNIKLEIDERFENAILDLVERKRTNR